MIFSLFTVYFIDIDPIFDILEIRNTETEDNESTITTYVMTYKFFVGTEALAEEMFHFSITSTKDDHFIKSISIFSEKENNVQLLAIVNEIVLNLDSTINIDEFDEKYNLLSQEENIFGEEAKFSVFKHVTDDYISVSLNIV